MSTYEFHEFLAVDRALTHAEQAALRKFSSRADITSSRFSVVYNWGSFRGNPDQLMERYFDAYLHVASWGARELQLRLPRNLFDPALAKPYLREESLSLRTTRDHVLLTFHVERDTDDEWTEGEGTLSSLLPLRAELLSGDLRALYLAWLSGVPFGGFEDDEEGYEDEEEEDSEEPPVPPGLRSRSAALEALVELLSVDPHLLAAAVQASPAPEAPPKSRELAAWLASLPSAEKDALLLRVLEGPQPLLGPELLQRFRLGQPRPQSSRAASSPRTEGQLRAAAEAHRSQRSRRQASQSARKRARQLEALATREPQVWEEVKVLFTSSKSRDLDEGVRLLAELRALAERRGSLDGFQQRLEPLRARHARRWSLKRRLEAAGL